MNLHQLYAPALVIVLSLSSITTAAVSYSIPRTATDSNIHSLVKSELARLGSKADLNHLDVSRVTDMSKLFANKKFNGDISRWDVRNVKNMSDMFRSSSFNGDISQWDVNTASLNTRGMFTRSHFIGDISGWYLDEDQLESSAYPNPLERFSRTPSPWGVSYGIASACALGALVLLYLMYSFVLRRTLRVYFEEKKLADKDS